jgi:UDP-N-acetylglucosamine 1-carboxyvinyltransferase
MDMLQVRGGKPLRGSVNVSGSKNAAMKLIIASIISDKRSVFFNVPDVPEVADVLSMCQEIGMEYVWDREAHILEVCTKELSTTFIPQKFSGSNRIPILMVGALLSRSDGEIAVPFINEGSHDATPFDYHVNALKSLGVAIEIKKSKNEGMLYASRFDGLKGSVITLPYPSLGATENAMLAAVTAHGTTIIRNAATDPEVFELMLFLQKLGCCISLDTDRVITIQGVRLFHSAEHTIMPDRVEVAFFATLALATDGNIMVRGCTHEHLITLLNTIREIGGAFIVSLEGGIQFFREKPLQGNLHLETDAFPGFLTDWQSFFAVLLTQAKGSSILHETVAYNSFGYVDTLNSMGANIALFRECLGGRTCRFNNCAHPHSTIIHGNTPLHGASIVIRDLRCPLAYLLAALTANGDSTITGIITQEHIFEKLRAVGAEISSVPIRQKGIPEPIDLFSFAKESFEVKKIEISS